MTPLREQLIAALTLKRYSPKTHEAYIRAVAGLARYYGRGPDQICNQEITAYLLHLHTARRLSASTLNVAVSGLRFFYAQVLERSLAEVEKALPRPQQPKQYARVYSLEEIRHLLQEGCRKPAQRVFLMTVYGAGLRLNEACHLKLEDIESRQARGASDGIGGQRAAQEAIGLAPAFLTGIGQLQNLTLPRYCGKRIAAADHFAVTGEVRGHAVVLLRPAPGEAKAGHDLVED